MEQYCTPDLICLAPQLDGVRNLNATPLDQPLQQLILKYMCGKKDILRCLKLFSLWRVKRSQKFKIGPLKNLACLFPNSLFTLLTSETPLYLDLPCQCAKGGAIQVFDKGRHIFHCIREHREQLFIESDLLDTKGKGQKKGKEPFQLGLTTSVKQREHMHV